MFTTTFENHRWLSVAALFGASAVLLGALGSHAMRHVLSSEALAVWRTGVEYQMFHALALLALTAGNVKAGSRLWPLRCWTLGILLFSGSLYLLALTGWHSLGLVTPFGGVCLVAGWFCLAFCPRKSQQEQ